MDAPAPRPLPFAHAADVVRARQKDEHCRGLLRRQLCGALEELLGHRRVGPWQAPAALLSDGAYALAAALCGRTLGEEYCELLAVGPGLRRPSRARRLLAAALALLPLAALERLARAPAGAARGRLARPLAAAAAAAASAVGPALRLHLALFYLSGAFRQLSDRCAGLRAVSLSERPYRSFSYRPLGVLLALQVFGQACARYMDWRRRRGLAAQEASLEAATSSFLGEPSTGEGAGGIALGGKGSCGGKPRRLPTCRICMCPAECPTAAPCGHLYCWDCVASWCATKASCPLCRASVLPQQLLPLNHYEVSPAIQ